MRVFLRANADLFGFDPSVADRVTANGTPSLLVVDALGGATLGEINIHVVNGTLVVDVMFWIDAQPKLGEADVRKRVVGNSYSERIGYGEPPQRDCAMTPAGSAGCQMPIRHWLTRQLTLTDSQVRATTWLMPDGDNIRLVACVNAESVEAPPADPSWGPVAASQRLFSPIGNAPALPMVVDLVTGQTLSVKVANCYAPLFTQVRDSH